MPSTTSIPPSRSTQVDKQPPRPRPVNDSRRDSHNSNEGKAAPFPSVYPTHPLPPVILLKGDEKDKIAECILKEREREIQEKEKIQEIEESNGWKFTSHTAGKMYLKIQEKDTSTFIECNNFARECKKAIRSDPRADSRVDSKRKGAPAPDLSILFTSETKAEHRKRLYTLLTTKNRYAQYWTIEDLPSEWLKIDNEALYSEKDQMSLLQDVEKKKRALEKSKPGGKVELGRHKERHRLSINDVKITSDDSQILGHQGPVYIFGVEGMIATEMRRSSRENLDRGAHGERRMLEDELEGETFKNKPRIHDTKVDKKIKNTQQAPTSGAGREQVVVEKPRGNTRTEVDERTKEGLRVPGNEVAKTRTAVAENLRHNGKKGFDEKSKGERQVLGDEIAKEKLVPTPINETEKEQTLVEKPRVGSKVKDDGNFNEDNVLPDKRYGSAAIDAVGDKKAVAIERSRNGTAETNKGAKDDSALPKKRHGSDTIDEVGNKRVMAVDKSRNGKAESDGRSKDNGLPSKKRHGNQ
ncbi:hypothetical protein BOTNAR_0099g00220 [Botryotinia narcissicola]|uniref:Uncharacterized protein n=1 Tax=Botryotinia narcissicola TaxID=278944 RepID=A0A4Z1IQ69_9HELO|nr:hypothetical protein BOTNAR_0099g00220 [Botryotinia narcissicola]